MATAAADLQYPLKRVQVRLNEETCVWKKLQNRPLNRGHFQRRTMRPKFLHLLIPREALTSLMVTSALAIKEKITIKKSKWRAVVPIVKEIVSDDYGW